jgi:hypothetical protein
MKLTNFLTKRLAALMVSAILFALGIGPAHTEAPRQKRNDRLIHSEYGPSGPNSSYRVGPRTRVYVTKRSWLDAGVDVLPGDRKFTDYAFPPGISFARQNKNSPIDRQPLNPQSDFGGGSRSFPF